MFVGVARSSAWASVCALLALLAPLPAHAVIVPPSFVVENAVPGFGFNAPVAVAFLPDGCWLVAERRGRVFIVQNGVKNPTPLINLEAEVLYREDRGLMSLAVDPDFRTNRSIYLLYTVDPDSNGVDDNDDAFARLTRYQVSASDPGTIDPASRTVLIGKSWHEGIPSGSPSHTAGALRWGADRSLLISAGDGAQFSQMDAGGLDPGLFGPDRTDPDQDIGAFRAQHLGSLAGKILRIDPLTGEGYPSNPFYDGDPRSNRSRVWAYGLRNPFRFTVRPGTGSTDPAAGNPGSLYVSDVGWRTWEECNVASSGGKNFGWPCYEGPAASTAYQTAAPARQGCASIGTADNPGVLTAPLITYHHSVPSLSQPQGITGNAATGGVFYTDSLYPAYYRQRYFLCDYGANWIKVAALDAGDHLVSLDPFAAGADGPVDVATDPQTGDVLYISIMTGELRRIRYTGPTGNAPPVVAAAATPTSGAAPLGVQFSSAGSFDPDNDPLSFGWSFGDGQGSIAASPSHSFAAPGVYHPVLTVTDGRGGLSRDTLEITVLPSVGFPSTGILDDFNRPSPALGAPWVGQTSGLAIDQNQLIQTSGSYVSPVWGGAVFGPDQEAFVTLDALTSSSPEHDLMLKIQGESWNAGNIKVDYDARYGTVYVKTYTPGVGWQSYPGSIPVAFQAHDVFGARALSSGDVEIYRNGVKLGTLSVRGWPYASQGGRVGLLLGSALTSRLDNFGGGNVVFPSNAPPEARIVSPLDRAFFAAGDTVRLVGSASDAEDPASSLLFQWEVDIHHNNHIHPDSYVFDGPSAAFEFENHDDGTGVHIEIRLIVTDTGGQRDTAAVDVYPEVDLEPGPVSTLADPVGAGSATEYRFKIFNRGRMPAPISRWQLTAGGVTLAAGDTLVAARDSVTIVRSLAAPLAPGAYTLRATVDALAQVMETHEANNAWNGTLTVAGPPGPPAGRFPTTPVLDDFNRPNAPLGAPWIGLTSGLILDQDQMVQGSGTYASPVWGGLAFGPDQEAFVTLDAITPGAPEHDLMLKIQGASWNAGHVKAIYDDTYKKVYVMTYTPGVGWQSYPGSIPVTFSAHDVFGARALSTSDIQIYRNGLRLGTLSVRGWPYAALGGRIGLLLGNAALSRLDNFGGGTVTRRPAGGGTASVPEVVPDPFGGPIPGTLSLSSPFPNPSPGGVSLRLDLPRAARVEMSVYDVSGRSLEQRTSDYRPGRWTLKWSRASGGAPAPPGLYFARVRAGSRVFERRFVLLQ